MHCLGQRLGRCLGTQGVQESRGHLLSHLIPLQEGLTARERRLLVEEVNLDEGWEEEREIGYFLG